MTSFKSPSIQENTENYCYMQVQEINFNMFNSIIAVDMHAFINLPYLIIMNIKIKNGIECIYFVSLIKY